MKASLEEAAFNRWSLQPSKCRFEDECKNIPNKQRLLQSFSLFLTVRSTQHTMISKTFSLDLHIPVFSVHEEEYSGKKKKKKAPCFCIPEVNGDWPCCLLKVSNLTATSRDGKCSNSCQKGPLRVTSAMLTWQLVHQIRRIQAIRT